MRADQNLVAGLCGCVPRPIPYRTAPGDASGRASAKANAGRGMRTRGGGDRIKAPGRFWRDVVSQSVDDA